MTVSKLLRKPLKSIQKSHKKFKIHYGDYLRRKEHGPTAPRLNERIWVKPEECNKILAVRLGQEYSAHVLDGDWDANVLPVEDLAKVSFCLKHWVAGVPWDETGAYEHMLTHIKEIGATEHGTTLADVVRRHEQLDEIYAKIRDEGLLQTRQELFGNVFREAGGIYIHINRDGMPIFGGSGCHRFSIARALGLPIIPAMVGVVHKQAIPVWRERYHAGKSRLEVPSAQAALPQKVKQN